MFSEHGTFIQPDALQYISSKEKPREFASNLIKHLKQYPLVLTVDQIYELESEQKEEVASESDVSFLQQKEQQNKLYEQLLDPLKSIPKEFSNEFSEDDRDDEDESIELESSKPQQVQKQKPEITITSTPGWKPLARDYDSQVEILKDITGNSVCEGKTDDFVKLFQDRYTVLKKILQSQRREIVNVMPLNRLKRLTQSEVQLIGVVSSVKTTTNGHRMIEIEDETGSARLMALKQNTAVMQLASEVLLDEIIGVVGKISKNGDLIIIDNLVFPDIRLQNHKNHAKEPINVAFLSDIHIGSNMFMYDQWNSFLKWINGGLGNSRQRKVAGTIKYLVLPGDLVDGIGIYPNQEKELEITNIYEQYQELARQLEHIPDYITIIVQPGNHDAVRPAEPQPAFEKEIQDLFQGKEIFFVGNPCYFSLHEVNILSYHGQSLLDYATNIQQLNYNQPTDAMKMMLRKRHLAPVYGKYTPLAPEHYDYMIIDQVPDIFVTGHVHTSNIDTYRGVTLINASSWQSQTSYQKMLNFIPDSAKLPIVNLATGTATTMDFSQKMS